MKRAVALGIVLAASGLVGLWFAWALREQAGVVSLEQLASAHDAEEALATNAGLEAIDHGVSDTLPFERAVPLEPGQCVALIVSLAGPVPLEPPTIALGPDDVIRSPTSSTRVAHLAACASEPTTATLLVPAPSDAVAFVARSLRFTILRGPLAAPMRSYTRLSTTPAERARLDARLVRARLDGGADARLAPVVVVPRETASVAPASNATFAALRVLMGRSGMAPALEPTLAAQDPFRVAGEVHVPPRVLAADGTARALVAIDAGALALEHGTRCLDVVLARLDDPSEPVPVRRISVPSRDELVLARDDEAIARDTVCGPGLYVYVTDEAAGGDYQLELRRAASEPPLETAAPTASSFGTSRRGEPLLPLPPLPVPALSRAVAECQEGDARACDRWAALSVAAIEGAGPLRAPLERLCTLEGGDACDRYATLLSAAGEPTAADDAERRACETGGATACLRRASVAREAGRFVEARALYQTGCARGSASACAAVRTMDEWQLGQPGAAG